MPDTLALFLGFAIVTCQGREGGTFHALSKDEPSPEFENRWSISLVTEGRDREGGFIPCLKPQAVSGPRRTSATSTGSYTTDTLGWGMVEMVPYSGKLRETLRDARLGSESRGGTLTITNIDNLVVLRWEERKQ